MKAPEDFAPFISVQEYLAQEELALEKHEYSNGRIYAMAGGSPAHAEIMANVAGSFVPRLRGHRCRGASADQRIKIEAANIWTYPDFIVKCPPERYAENDRNSLVNPALVVEVLSPSTEKYDRDEKFALYAQIPELQDYLLVAQNRVLVEHFQRGENESWILRRLAKRDDVLKLTNLEIEIPVGEFYDGLDVPEGLLMIHSQAQSPPQQTTV